MEFENVVSPLAPGAEVSNVKKAVKSRNKFFIPVLLFIGFLFFVLLIYLFTNSDFLDLQKLTDVSERSEIEEQLEGEIYLTLAPMGGFVPPSVHRLDLETGEIEEFFVEKKYSNYYMGKFSLDGHKMVFTKTSGTSLDGVQNQVVLFDIENQEISGLTPKEYSFPRNANLSSDGESLVYWSEGFSSMEMALENSETPYEAEDYTIFLFSLLTDKHEEVAHGAYPLFLPDGESILFLKNDGLYILDLFERNEELVLYWNVNSQSEVGLVENVRFTISPEGDNLLLTDSFTASVRLLNVFSWFPFSYEKKFELELLLPIWPVFSPDGLYFAVQNFESHNDYTIPKIDIFELESLDLKASYSLKDYDPETIWITDWIKK